MQEMTTVTPRIGKIKGNILKHAVPREVLGIAGANQEIGKNQSDTVIFRRWLPYGGATTNSTTINTWTVDADNHQVVEGVPPDVDTISAQDITVTINEYACLYQYSNKVAVLYEDNIPDAQKKQTGQRMGLLREMIRYGALKGCTNRFYSGGTTRATVDESITLQVLRRISRSLEGNRADRITEVLSAGAKFNTTPVEAGFLVFHHTDLNSDVRDLEGFTKCVEYGTMKQIHPREVGACEDFRFISSPELTKIADSGAAVAATNLLSTTGTSIDIYPTIVVASDAWADLALRGMSSFNLIHLPHNQKSKSDPLGQKGYIGAHFFSAAFIQNDGWMAVLECGANDLTP